MRKPLGDSAFPSLFVGKTSLPPFLLLTQLKLLVHTSEAEFNFGSPKAELRRSLKETMFPTYMGTGCDSAMLLFSDLGHWLSKCWLFQNINSTILQSKYPSEKLTKCTLQITIRKSPIPVGAGWPQAEARRCSQTLSFCLLGKVVQPNNPGLKGDSYWWCPGNADYLQAPRSLGPLVVASGSSLHPG